MSKNKTFSSEILQRYALALYELSKETNQTDQFVSNLKTFMKIYKSSDDLKDFIKNPTNSQESQKTWWTDREARPRSVRALHRGA